MQSPSCGQLLLTWLLLAISVGLVQMFGHVGIFGSLLLIPIWARLRGDHDRAISDRLFRSKGLAPRLTAAYYLVICALAFFLVWRGEKFNDLPFVGFLIVMMFPVLAAMVVADHAVCRRNRREGDA